MENGITLQVIWFDEVEDLLEAVFSCSNGYFSGQAEISQLRLGSSCPHTNPDEWQRDGLLRDGRLREEEEKKSGDRRYRPEVGTQAQLQEALGWMRFHVDLWPGIVRRGRQWDFCVRTSMHGD